jgi:hypothetical protein
LKKFVQTIISIILFLLVIQFNTNAQDIIIKKDGEVIHAKIVIIRDSSIIYYKWLDQDSIIFETPKWLIDHVSFSEINSDASQKVERSIEQGAPIGNIKLGVSSIIQHTIQLGYERMIAVHWALEGTIHRHAHIGFIDDNLFDVDGWGIDFGVKYFILRNKYIDSSQRSKSLLNGPYLKGMVYFTDRIEFNFSEISDYQAWISGIQLGHEFSNKYGFNLDTYFGFHLASGKNTISPIDGRFQIPGKLDLSESNYINVKNFIFSAGLKLGYYF